MPAHKRHIDFTCILCSESSVMTDTDDAVDNILGRHILARRIASVMLILMVYFLEGVIGVLIAIHRAATV